MELLKAAQEKAESDKDMNHVDPPKKVFSDNVKSEVDRNESNTGTLLETENTAKFDPGKSDEICFNHNEQTQFKIKEE